MKINSLKLSKILSFGPEQRLNEFSSFNLFIGRNGSGKTNIFRLLEGKCFDFNKLHCDGGVFIKSEDLNREYSITDEEGILEIKYQDSDCRKLKEINFTHKQYGQIGNIQLETGDAEILGNEVVMLKLRQNGDNFIKSIISFKPEQLTLLNLGLYFIFGYHYKFSQDGSFLQTKIRPGGSLENDPKKLPSGVMNCSEILTEFIKEVYAEKSVILIDEPEIHLEPRTIRKLFQYLVWILIREKTNNSKEAGLLCNNIESFRKKMEHPELFANLPNINQQDELKQLFFCSHSPILLNEFISLGKSASIYEFGFKEGQYQIIGTTKFEPALFSQVRKVGSDAISVVDELGCKGSDLLQTNGVIWVEGPSDVIYLKKWLEMYSREKSLEEFVQGRHYEFQMFGGTNLVSLCLIQTDTNQDDYKKLVAMFSFSRNAFVIYDSDAVKDKSGSVKDKSGSINDNSNFKNAKQYIKKQFDILTANGNRSLGLWYKENNTEIRTIESYLDNCSKKAATARELEKDKKGAAIKITNSWGTSKTLSEFKHDLENEIKLLYDCIVEWNK